jgi:hypothetical protein
MVILRGDDSTAGQGFHIFLTGVAILSGLV